jgi:release factor glutamine methyltransferase
VDVVAGVVPYVPTGELSLLQRDTFTFETPLAYDGGPDGCAILRRAIAGAVAVLRPGGALLLELGGDQASLLAPDLAAFDDVRVLRDEDGDVRGVEATTPSPR